MASTREWFETVEEARRRARRRLPRSVYMALIAGTEKGVTLHDNTAAFSELKFAPPRIADLPAVREMATSVLGQEISMPVIASPTGVQAVHPDGEAGVARGTAEAGTAMGLSSFGSTAVEAVAEVNPKLFFQSYWSGGRDKILVLTVDGSFCNRTCFGGIPERTILLARCRKDAKLCFRAVDDPRRFYAVDKFTPEMVRQDEDRDWKTTKIFYGGKRRPVRYKQVANIYWQGGAKKLPLRLIVIAPTPYRKSQSKKMYYRDPAYLLTSDQRSSIKQLLQIYFDRWQIEVNHREEKDTLGVGQAQLWNAISVPKQPVLAVAAYSALLLASLLAFGAERGNAYAELPKWRRKARRPSALDLVTLLRKEMTQQPELLAPLGFQITDQALVGAADA